MIVGASCTAELIQDDTGGLASTLGLPCPVIPLDLPSYQRKENFGADETFPPSSAPSRQPGAHRAESPATSSAPPPSASATATT